MAITGNIIHSKITILLWAACALLMVYSAPAQDSAGIQGQITDPASALVVNTEVSLINKNGISLKTKTDHTGVYLFRSLLPGRYKVRVETSDFAPFVSEDISLEAGKTKAYNIQLAIKQIDENVDINSDTDASSRLSGPAGEMVIKGAEVNNLPDDPEALAAALKAMALSGPGEPQIYVDDFPSAKPPPKQTIKEIRISQNYMSAEEDRPGGARISIITKVGANKLQGSAYFNVSDRVINARNPFASESNPYIYRQYGFFLSRAIVPKKTAFSFSFSKLDENRNGVVSAETLDPGLNIVPLRLSVVIPRRDLSLTPRFDFQLNEKNTLILRYLFNRTTVENLGVGELSLPGRGYDLKSQDHTIRLTETAVLNAQSVNEFRFQFVSESLESQAQVSEPVDQCAGCFYGRRFAGGRKQNYCQPFRDPELYLDQQLKTFHKIRREASFYKKGKRIFGEFQRFIHIHGAQCAAAR